MDEYLVKTMYDMYTKAMKQQMLYGGTTWDIGGSKASYTFIDEWSRNMKKGDRVRIKEGYDRAGEVAYYEAKSNDSDRVIVTRNDRRSFLLADAIEPYPYTREERIERAIEDYYELHSGDESTDNHSAILFAILDAGV